MQIVAYVLIQAEPGKAWDIAKTALKVKGVKKAHAVTGPYDVIVDAEVVDLSALENLILEIHGMEGVQRTQTAVSV